MKHIVALDNLIITVDLHAFENVSPKGMTCDSDWDSFGYVELDYSIESVVELDEDDIPYDVAALDVEKMFSNETFTNIFEQELLAEIKQQA